MDTLTTQQTIAPDPILSDDENPVPDDGDVVDPGFTEAEPGIGNDVDPPDPDTLPGGLDVIDDDVVDRPV
ncbi:MAG TPA: hypothetical protein VF682_25840 [Pseudomonas sp.]|jgi:hypothetical protein